MDARPEHQQEPDGDDDADGIPDEAVGDCPDPFGLAGPATPLRRASYPERFFQFKWLPVSAPSGASRSALGLGPDPGSGVPDQRPVACSRPVRIRPDEQWPAGTSAWDPADADPLLLASARHRPTDGPLPQPELGTGNAHAPADPVAGALGSWGSDPAWIQNGGLRIGVHRGGPSTVTSTALYRRSAAATVDMQVWSGQTARVGGAYDGDGRDPVCTSGAVRLDVPPGVLARRQARRLLVSAQVRDLATMRERCPTSTRVAGEPGVA
jgi:hypothetical protein